MLSRETKLGTRLERVAGVSVRPGAGGEIELLGGRRERDGRIDIYSGIAACAAANRAIGIRKGLQLT